MRYRVPVTIIFHVIVRCHFHTLIFRVFIGIRGEWFQHRGIKQAKAFCPALATVSFHRALVQFMIQFAQATVEAGQCVKHFVTYPGQHPTLNDLYRDLDFRLVFGFIGAGGQDNRLIMRRQSLVTQINGRFIAISFVNPTFQVIGDKQLRYAIEKV
jgi:hypothetical protein